MRGVRATRRVLLGMALALLLGGAGSWGQSVVSPEQVKAGFLSVFGNYVDWPPSAFPSADTPFTIGVLGKDTLGSLLDKTVEKKSVNGRKILIRRFRRPEDVQTCHILFICASERAKVAQILERLGRTNTLTVGETGEFLQRGGMIHIALEKKDRLEINPDAAERAGLKISSDILKLARNVRRGG